MRSFLREQAAFASVFEFSQEPGEARWTSPNLYYYETFAKPAVGNKHSDALIKMAFPPKVRVVYRNNDDLSCETNAFLHLN